MKTFAETAAQGDVYFVKMPAGFCVPGNAVPEKAEGGRVIVAHSDSGHSHVMDASTVTMYRMPDSIMECLLVVDQPTPLEHLREHDAHEPILFEPGIYKAINAREYTPEGWRRAQD
jgi:hypothetical protein